MIQCCVWMKWEWKPFDWLWMWIFWINCRLFARVSRNAWLLAASLCLFTFTWIVYTNCTVSVFNIVCFMFSRFALDPHTQFDWFVLPFASGTMKKKERVLADEKQLVGQPLLVCSCANKYVARVLYIDWFVNVDYTLNLYVDFFFFWISKFQIYNRQSIDFQHEIISVISNRII